MSKRFSSAELCRKNGWKRGTVLEGTESGDGWSNTTRIRITAVGDEEVLAVELRKGGCEGPWTLGYRDWHEVAPVAEGAVL